MEEIGRRLRAAREARGITLEVAEEETKIRRKYLESLESGEEAGLPGDAYLKGFLRTYGNYLGLEGPALVEEYKQHKEPREAKPVAPAEPANAREREREAARAQRQAQRKAAETTVSKPAVEPQPTAPVKRERPRTAAVAAGPGTGRAVGMVVFLVLLGALVVYAGWLIFRQVGEPAPTSDPPPPPPVVETKPEPAPEVKVPEPPKVTMTRGTGEDVLFAVPAPEVTVTVEANGGAVWASISVNGAKAVDERISGAKEYKGKQLKIRMGHMEGVNLVINGQRFDKPLSGGPYNLIMNGQ